MALVDVRVLEVLSGKPLATAVARDLHHGTFVLQVSLDTLQSPDFLEAREALDLETRALVLDVLFKVRHEDTLLHLEGIAPMKHFDLPKHLGEDLVLDRSEDALNGCLA